MPEASHRWVKKSVLESGKGNFSERTNWVDQSKLDPLKILLRNIGPSERPFEDFNSGPRRGWPVEHVRVLVEKNMVPQRSLIMGLNEERRKVCQFLLGLGTATLALFLFPVSLFSRQKEFPYANVASRKSSTPSANRKSKIVMARSDLVQTQEAKINGEVARQMVHEGMKKLAGTPTLSSAWKSFFGPDDIVGIKVNCLGGNMLPPHVEVVMAVVDGLKSAGIVEEDIIIWDRSTSELKRAGFKINVRGRG
ncbi:MAG: hypothetical protein ABID54_07105, partial [Pseudomonadota bacterium]